MGKLSNKKIVFLLAPNDFRDEEYFQPKVVLQAEGAQIFTAVKGDPEEVTGSKGGKAHITAPFKDLIPENFDAIVVVGGKGVKKYFNDKSIHQVLNNFNNQSKIIAAICSGPVVLANAGLLTSKKVTSWDKEKDILEAQKAIWVNKPTITDGNIITSQGPQTAIDFGQQIINSLIK